MTRFGHEMKRPNPTEPSCFDCAELYYGCTGRPPDPNRKTRCRDTRKLPDVGINGQTGQQFPASRMNGRTEPRLETNELATTPTITPPPKATPKHLSARKCDCGAFLPKRRRFCDSCRDQRRRTSYSKPRKH